jgi:hypothetical protein
MRFEVAIQVMEEVQCFAIFDAEEEGSRSPRSGLSWYELQNLKVADQVEQLRVW